MLKALSIASSASAGMKIQFGNEMKVVHLGLAAQNGIQAAYLAKENIEANKNFYDDVDGFKTLYGTLNSKTLDESNSSRKLGFATIDYPVIKKPWPSCACTHRIVEASEILSSKIDNIQDINNVIINTPEPYTKVSRFHVPNNEAEARFSPTYCAMITLRNGKLVPDDFMNDIYLNNERQELTKIAQVVPYKVPLSFTEMSPDFPCKIIVKMNNGNTLDQSIGDVKGGVNRIMSIDELKIKFMQCSENLDFFENLLNSNYQENTKNIIKI